MLLELSGRRGVQRKVFVGSGAPFFIHFRTRLLILPESSLDARGTTAFRGYIVHV